MYRGETSIDQEHLKTFIRTANALKIKGLTDVCEKKLSSTDQALSNNQSIDTDTLRQQQDQHLQQQRAEEQQKPNMILTNPFLDLPTPHDIGRQRKTANEMINNNQQDLEQSSPIVIGMDIGTEGYKTDDIALDRGCGDLSVSVESIASFLIIANIFVILLLQKPTDTTETKQTQGTHIYMKYSVKY
jgi:hypothetical protein